MLSYQIPSPYLAPKCSNILVRMGGWVGGPTVIIGLVSVQVELKLDLPTGTELGKM